MSSSNGVSHATGFGHTYGFGHGLFGQSYSYSHSHSHGHPQFYFDPDMDSPHRRPDCCSTKSELRDTLESLADVTEKIKEVRYYTHPLNTWQTSRYAFIVLETDSWWWSVDKDDRGITIQRSKYVENVRDNCRRQPRSAGLTGSGIEMAKNPSCNISVIELLNRFWMRDRVNVEIHFQANNGYQHFADILYDFV